MESDRGKKQDIIEKELQKLIDQLSSENAALSKILKLVSKKDLETEKGIEDEADNDEKTDNKQNE